MYPPISYFLSYTQLVATIGTQHTLSKQSHMSHLCPPTVHKFVYLTSEKYLINIFWILALSKCNWKKTQHFLLYYGLKHSTSTQ